MRTHTHTEQKINNEKKKEWNRTVEYDDDGGNSDDDVEKKTEGSEGNNKELNGHGKEQKLK